MLRFRQFILEYLTPEEKEKVASWKKRTPQATKATDHFFGVGNEEHHEPLVDTEDKSEVHREIERHLGRNISSDEYKSGMIKGEKGKERIGSIVSDPSLKTKFKTDNTRKNVRANSLSVRTTRSAEGVAGQTSHGQSWEGHSCKNFNDGSNNQYLPHEVRHGTVVSYLHDHEGKEIARATFQPHINAEGNTVYRRDSYYGLKHPAFEKHNMEMEKRLSQPHRGSPVYTLHPKVYNDSAMTETVHPSEEESMMNSKDTDSSSLKVIAHRTNDPKKLKKILYHPNADQEVFHKIISKSSDPEIREYALNHPKVNDTVLQKIVSNSTRDDVDLHKRLLQHPKTGSLTLTTLANRTNDPEIHKAIMNHRRADHKTLEWIARNSKDLEIHKAILNHPKVKDNVLGVIYERNAGRKEMIKTLLNHPKVGNDTLTKIGRRSMDPEVQKAILNHPRTGMILHRNTKAALEKMNAANQQSAGEF